MDQTNGRLHDGSDLGPSDESSDEWDRGYISDSEGDYEGDSDSNPDSNFDGGSIGGSRSDGQLAAESNGESGVWEGPFPECDIRLFLDSHTKDTLQELSPIEPSGSNFTGSDWRGDSWRRNWVLMTVAYTRSRLWLLQLGVVEEYQSCLLPG